VALLDLALELRGQFPGLSFLLAQSLVNRAWADVRDGHLWSWLTAEGVLIAPAAIAAGTVTVTFGSTSVIGDATAAAAWLAVALANPPLASATLGAGRQFRTLNGPLYNIVGFDGVNTLTLERAFSETSGAGQTYQVYRAYFRPPQNDFLRYLALTRPDFGYAITGRKLYLTQEELNRRDPQRGATGDAYYAAAYRVDASGIPVHELWPHQVNQAAFVAMFQRRGVNLSAPGASPVVDVPVTVMDYLVKARAEYYGAQWAVKNVRRLPELGGTNWLAVMQAAQANFREEMVKAVKQDKEIFLSNWILPKGASFGFPLDGRFLQSHDISGWGFPWQY
jgi:hypothetical protein